MNKPSTCPAISGIDTSGNGTEILNRRQFAKACMTLIAVSHAAAREDEKIEEEAKTCTTLTEWFHSSSIKALHADIEEASKDFVHASTPYHEKNRAEALMRKLLTEGANPIPLPLQKHLKKVDINRDLRFFMENNMRTYSGRYPFTMHPGKVSAHLVPEWITAHTKLNLEVHPDVERVLRNSDVTITHGSKGVWNILAALCHKHSILLEASEKRWNFRVEGSYVPESLAMRLPTHLERHVRTSGNLPIVQVKEIMRIDSESGEPLIDPESKSPLWNRIDENYPLEHWRKFFDDKIHIRGMD